MLTHADGILAGKTPDLKGCMGFHLLFINRCFNLDNVLYNSLSSYLYVNLIELNVSCNEAYIYIYIYIYILLKTSHITEFCCIFAGQGQ